MALPQFESSFGMDKMTTGPVAVDKRMSPEPFADRLPRLRAEWAVERSAKVSFLAALLAELFALDELPVDEANVVLAWCEENAVDCDC